VFNVVVVLLRSADNLKNLSETPKLTIFSIAAARAAALGSSEETSTTPLNSFSFPLPPARAISANNDLPFERTETPSSMKGDSSS
jgi:hypothetical protein